MPLNPTYSAGTVSVTTGGTTVTGNLTLWLAAGIREGDVFECRGLTATIASVNSSTLITLVRPWFGATVTGSEYEIRYIADAARVIGAARTVVERFEASQPLFDGAYASYENMLDVAPTLAPTVRAVKAVVGGTETRWVRNIAGTALGGGWSPADMPTPQNYGGANSASLAAAVSGNANGTIRIDYDEQNLPPDFSGVLLEYTKRATARNIQQTGPGAGVGMRTFRTQFPENHTGFQYHALNIEAVSRGSGVNGPTTVENGLTINVAKRGFASGAARAGAFNCMYLYGRQDGPKGLPAGDIGSSDIGGIIANLSIVEDAGFLCIGEATSTQIQGSAPFGQLLQLQTQYGVINGNAAGGSKSYGWLAISKVGENTAAYYASSEGASSWSSLFLSPNKLNIDSNGDYRSTQTSWTSGALNLERDKSIVNGNSTIRHRGTGSMRILTQESANISFGTANTIHVRLGADGHFVPAVNEGANLGQPSFRFGGTYTRVLSTTGPVTMAGLPTSNPADGTSRLWMDPATRTLRVGT